MDQNCANSKAFISVANILRYPGYAIWKLTFCRFFKCGGFLCYHFLNRIYYCSKSGQIWFFFWKMASSKKMTTPQNFGLPNPPKSEDADLCPQKNMILGLILGQKPWFHQFWPHLTPPPPCHTWISPLIIDMACYVEEFDKLLQRSIAPSLLQYSPQGHEDMWSNWSHAAEHTTPKIPSFFPIRYQKISKPISSKNMEKFRNSIWSFLRKDTFIVENVVQYNDVNKVARV